MKLRWQWFLGGRIMFCTTIIVFILLIIGFICSYIIDPITAIYMKKQSINAESIKEISETYVKNYGITIDKPIIYRFVKYRNDKNYCKSGAYEEVLLGTFHEWNGNYYIDISVDLYKADSLLEETVIHETRHMIVDYLKDEYVINLIKYTEEIAEEKDQYYNNMFDSGVYLLKALQERNKYGQ